MSGGEWVDPNGNPLSCNTNPLHCDKTTKPASISLYRPNGGITFNEAGVTFTESLPNNNFYKCCLPTSCSDPTTNMITVNIFCKLYFIVIVYIVICYPFPPIFVNKTATTITVSWIPVPSNADGYVVNATSETHTVTQQVMEDSQNKVILKGLIPVTTYNITVRAYQDILGPASNTTSVQTNINLTAGKVVL